MVDDHSTDEMARARTEWAEDRTIMANERTFASWLGAGMGAIGVAIALKAVFGDFEPTWAAKAVASIFLLIALLLFWSARNRACATFERLHQHCVTPPSNRVFTLIAVAMSVATLSVGAILWSL